MDGGLRRGGECAHVRQMGVLLSHVHDDSTHRHGVGEVDGGQAGRQLQSREPREDSDAHARGNESQCCEVVLTGGEAPAFESGRGARMVDDLARRPGPHVVVDPVFVLEVDEWHRLSTGEPVAFGDHDPIVIVEERDTPHLRQVDLPVLRNLRPDLDEAVPAPVLCRLVELDIETQVRMVLGDGFDDARQQTRIERGERRDPQPGSADIAEALDQIVEAADRGEDLCRVVGQASAELGDLDAAPGPVGGAVCPPVRGRVRDYSKLSAVVISTTWVQ